MLGLKTERYKKLKMIDTVKFYDLVEVPEVVYHRRRFQDWITAHQAKKGNVEMA